MTTKNTFKPVPAAILFLLTFSCFSAFAQLNPLASQYFQNQYLANPAMAGSTAGLNLNTDFRKKWDGFPGAPTTYAFTADYRISKVGIGLNILNENAGAINQLKVMGTYAYYLPLSSEGESLSLGFSLGLTDDRLDMSKLDGDLLDPSLSNFNDQNPAYLDGDFGISYNRKKLNLQVAVPNLKSFFNKEDNQAADRPVFFTSASYKMQLGKEPGGAGLEPKLVLRSISGYKNIIDAGANLTLISNKLMVFGMYHSTESATFGFGMNYGSFSLLNFYNTDVSAISGNMDGSFEFSLRLNLFK